MGPVLQSCFKRNSWHYDIYYIIDFILHQNIVCLMCVIYYVYVVLYNKFDTVFYDTLQYIF